MSRLRYSSAREAGSSEEEIECETRLGFQGSTGNSDKEKACKCCNQEEEEATAR
jgi:hypothetical protein